MNKSFVQDFITFFLINYGECNICIVKLSDMEEFSTIYESS